ncbi:hypothetical protein D3C73_458470 [compost metagenome]
MDQKISACPTEEPIDCRVEVQKTEKRYEIRDRLVIGEKVGILGVFVRNAKFAQQNEMAHLMGDRIEVQRKTGGRRGRFTLAQFQKTESRLGVFPLRDVRHDLQPVIGRLEEPIDAPSDVTLANIQHAAGAGVAVG